MDDTTKGFLLGAFVATAFIAALARARLPAAIDTAVRAEVQTVIRGNAVLNALPQNVQWELANTASRVARDAAMRALPV